MLIHSAVITGSVQLNNTDVSSIINVAGFATTSSVNALSSSIVSVVKSKMDTDGVVSGSSQLTSSYDNRYVLSGSITQTTWDNIANKPAGIVSSSAQIIELGFSTTSSVNDLQSKTGSYATTSSFGAYTSSNDSTNTTQNTRLSTIESRTGSFATTGSNTFIGTNVFTGSVFITSDLIVQGSSSLQNITASAVSIGTNTVILNTNTPILQFGGISVQDSGSTAGRSGSLLWNSINDHWINVNPSGSDEGYNSAMIINGPKNTGSLGAEVGLTTNYIPVSQGEDHITDSIIFQSGNSIGIRTTSPNLNNFGAALTISASSGYAGVEVYGSGSNNGGQIDFGSGNIRYASVSGEFESSTNGFLNIRTRKAGSMENAVRITSAGNVGIGISNPTTKLVVLGTSVSAGVDGIIYGNTASGHSNYAVLGVTGNAFSYGSISANTTIVTNASSSKMAIGTLDAQPLQFVTDYVERMRILSGGAVLINRTTQNNPSGTSLLEIGGSQSSNGLVRIVNAVNQGDVNHGSLIIINTANYAIGNDASIGFALNRADNSYTDPRASIGCKTESSYGGALVFNTRLDSGTFTERMRITSAGTVQPGANGTQDLGTSSLRWGTIYTSDLSLSNGIGDYTIVEGEEKLYLYNNKNNKVYSFVLQEEDPLTATPKKS